MIELAFQVLVGSAHPTGESFVEIGARSELIANSLIFLQLVMSDEQLAISN
jgi:hypothetical protein